MRRRFKSIVYVFCACIIAFLILWKESNIIESLVTKSLENVATTNVNDDNIPDSSGIDDNSNNDGDYKPLSSSFNKINPHSDSWCPNARCYNSPLCLPCQRRYLFILATGRSGSTTLLKMLNELPNVRLSGENYNAVFQMYSLLQGTVLKDYDYSSNFKNEDAMKKGLFIHEGMKEGPFAHNAIPMGSYACVLQHLANALNPPEIILQSGDDDSQKEDQHVIEDIIHNSTQQLAYIDQDSEDRTILGMKEIRFQNQDLIPWTPNEACTFLQDNFPCTRYIINVNSNYTHQSKAMKQHLKQKVDGLNRTEIKEKIKTENHFLLDLSTLLGNDTARLIYSEDWQKDVNVLNDVVDWLGFKGCKFEILLHENQGGFDHDEKNKLYLGDKCRFPY